MKESVGYVNIHPGMVLRDEIEARKLSKVELAKQMDIPYKVLSDILNEQSPVTLDIAMRFEIVLGLDADFLIRFQAKYDMRELKEKKSYTKLLSDLKKKKPKAKSKVAAMV
jgi:addiction module HigA family antidote